MGVVENASEVYRPLGTRPSLAWNGRPSGPAGGIP